MARDSPREVHGLDRSLLPPSRRTRLPLVEARYRFIYRRLVIVFWFTEAIPRFWPFSQYGGMRMRERAAHPASGP